MFSACITERKVELIMAQVHIDNLIRETAEIESSPPQTFSMACLSNNRFKFY